MASVRRGHRPYDQAVGYGQAASGKRGGNVSTRRILAAAPLFALLLGSCGGGHHTAVPTSAHPAAVPASAKPVHGASGRFLQWVRLTNPGNKNYRSAPDAQILQDGQAVCNGLTTSGLTYSQVVARLVAANAGFTPKEARQFTQHAVRGLCPQEKAKLPAGK
jgi:hypothetical protein